MFPKSVELQGNGRHVKKPAAVLALAASIACLAACGGDESSTPPTRSPAPSDGATTAETAETAGLSSPGTISPRSAEFESEDPGAKLHLAEFGGEATGDDRKAVSTLVVAYLQALGREDWAKACTYLLAEAKAQAQQFAAQTAPGTGAGCGETLPVFAKGPGGWDSARPVYASEGIASLRIKVGGRAGDGAGFALFHGSDGAEYWMAVKSSGGGWKVLSAAPIPVG